MAASRHALDLFDPELAREHTRAQLRSKYGEVKFDPSKFKRTQAMDDATRERQEKLRDAMAEEAKLRRTREEELRKRDPTFRPDAIELNMKDVKLFDREVDCET